MKYVIFPPLDTKQIIDNTIRNCLAALHFINYIEILKRTIFAIFLLSCFDIIFKPKSFTTKKKQKNRKIRENVVDEFFRQVLAEKNVDCFYFDCNIFGPIFCHVELFKSEKLKARYIFNFSTHTYRQMAQRMALTFSSVGSDQLSKNLNY